MMMNIINSNSFFILSLSESNVDFISLFQVVYSLFLSHILLIQHIIIISLMPTVNQAYSLDTRDSV